MSLKAIELQVALPRTHDAGKLQEQMQQKGQLNHDFAAREMKKEAGRKEKTVVKKKQKDNVKLKREENSVHHDSSLTLQEQESEVNETINSAKHPYKGNAIDFSG
ncbi:hypothetical protein IEO70_13800 [Bacillus sp. AGMB 02131]|uniref:RNA polymerase subunit sigma n=1 Tax=Peribacillus faecalis TaxID=2772559 RepID=A0A927HCA7_9BACI|nr:hypothetical protein [Peribacillus faecalis]MBD3109417.1 hypothetical protein [Peribacillus faecalis]